MTSSRPYEKRSRNGEAREYDLLEGTSARTRPFSFDEIMQGRKNREDVANRVGSDCEVANTTSSRDGIEKVLPPSEYGQINDSSGSNDMNHTSNDVPQKESFQKKGDSNMSRKNSKLVQDDRKGSQHQDTDSRRTEDKNVNSNRITETHDVKYHHSESRKHDDSDFGVGKGQDGDSNNKEKVPERSRIRSAITRPEDSCNNRLADSKRKNDKRINNDYQYKRRNGKDAINTGKLIGRVVDKSEITRPEDYRNDRLVDQKRKNDQRINNSYEYKKRNEKDAINSDKLTGRGGNKSELTRPEDYRKDRPADRKRKNDERIDNNYVYKKRNEKDAIETDKLTGRGGDKSERENKHRHHANEEDKTRDVSSAKKHDVSKNKDSEPTRPSFEVSGRKRRHSQSRDRTKERGRRSRSHSPKAHKHTPIERKEPMEISSQSIKDKSEREHSDIDKRRTSHNESGNHYKRNTGPSSGLGGYSPRKRKTGSGLKTPSPTRRSPERRPAGWDLQPVENVTVIPGPPLANPQSTNQTFSWKINETPSITPVTPLSVRSIENTYQNLVSQMQAIESVQLTEATRPLRRLYVENVPTSVSDKDLIECVNNYLLTSGVNHIQGTQPCISCIMHREKAQALLEFLTPEDASAALSLDSISFSGASLKLRRPKDYSATTGIVEKSVAAAGSRSGVVEDSPNKIFVGCIPKLISSTMLLEIARTFGAVKAYHYESNADINESYAFLEYVDHSVTPKACAGLNGMRLGGQVITAALATRDAALENIGKEPFYGIPEHAKPLLEKPTSVLKLKNILDPESLLSEVDMQEILEDVRLECSRFGMVKSVNVSKRTNSSVTSEAREASDTNASINEHDESYGTLKESEEQDRSDPRETVNGPNQRLRDTNSSNDDTYPDNMKDQPSSDESIPALEPSGGFTRESTSQHNADEGANKSEDSEVKETDPDVVIPFDMKNDGLKSPSAPEEGHHEDDIFEPGSIFVEYRRAEAACIAAHSLHERTFDGRIVKVEYVDHDLYTRRFQG